MLKLRLLWNEPFQPSHPFLGPPFTVDWPHVFAPWLATKKVSTAVDTHQKRCFFEIRKFFSSWIKINICVWYVKNPNWGPWNRDPSWTFSPDQKLSCMLHDLRGVGSILGCWNLKLKSSKKWIHLASFTLGSFKISILEAYLLFKWEKCIGVPDRWFLGCFFFLRGAKDYLKCNIWI